MSVLARVQAYEMQGLTNLKQQMSRQLAMFLETCWHFRNNLNLQNGDGELDIYCLYCNRAHSREDRPEGWESTGFGKIPMFFESLLQAAARCQLMIQPYTGGLGELLAYIEENSAFTQNDDAHKIRTILNNARRQPAIWGPVLWDLGMSFFHFLRDDSAAMRRVYLNVLPEFRVRVSQFLAQELDVPEAVRFKVAGPLAKGYDTIVIYISKDQGVAKVVDALGDYQKTASMFFSSPVVNIAKPAHYDGKLLRGVAIATEPGDFRNIDPIAKRNPSFGDFWELLLRPSLMQAKSEIMFFQLALDTMRKLKIDPMNPAIFQRK